MTHSFEALKDGLPESLPENPGPEHDDIVLLDGVTEDREYIDGEARAMQTEVVDLVTEAVERGVPPSPTVFALVGFQRKLFFPYWKSDLQKVQIFRELDEHLEDASATVTAVPGSYVNREDLSTNEIRNHPERVPALIIVTRTAWAKELFILPYTVADDGTVDWKDPIVRDRFDYNLLSVPRAN